MCVSPAFGGGPIYYRLQSNLILRLMYPPGHHDEHRCYSSGLPSPFSFRFTTRACCCTSRSFCWVLRLSCRAPIYFISTISTSRAFRSALDAVIQLYPLYLQIGLGDLIIYCPGALCDDGIGTLILLSCLSSWAGSGGHPLRLNRVKGSFHSLSVEPSQYIAFVYGILEAACRIARRAFLCGPDKFCVPDSHVHDHFKELLISGQGHIQLLVAGDQADFSHEISSGLCENEDDDIRLLALWSGHRQTSFVPHIFRGETLNDSLDLCHILAVDPILSGSVGVYCAEQSDHDADMGIITPRCTPW